MAAVVAVLALASNNDVSSLRADGATTTVDGPGASGDPDTTDTTAGVDGSTPTTGTDGQGTGSASSIEATPGDDTATTTAGGAGATTGEDGPGATTAGAGTLRPTTTAAGETDPVPTTGEGGGSTTGGDAPGTVGDSPGGEQSGQAPQDGGAPGTAPDRADTETAPGPEGAAIGTGPPDTGEGGGGGLASTLRTVATAAGLALSAAGVLYLAGSILQAILQIRRRADDDPGVADDLDGPVQPIVIDPTVTGWTLERLRAELESEPDPRLAVRKAYALVESGFGGGGGLARRHTETPLQYIERTLGVIEGATDPLRVLTGLFLLARFSNRPMNEPMRRAAIDAVVQLQAHYREAEQVAA